MTCPYDEKTECNVPKCLGYSCMVYSDVTKIDDLLNAAQDRDMAEAELYHVLTNERMERDATNFN